MKAFKFGMFCWFVFFLQSLQAQTVFHHYFQDTIKPKYRISGPLDSVDVILGNYQTTLNGGYRALSTTFKFSDLTQPAARTILQRYSSIPHVAFGYSMGSKLDQIGRITYTQVIDTNVSAQFDYLRRTNNGTLRNGAYETNQVDFALSRRGKWYGTALSTRFFGGYFNVNGGLLGGSLTNDFGLDFQLVKKENAKRTFRNFNVRWENYFSFIHRDTVERSKAGLYLAAELDIQNNRYQESDTLFGIYSIINYDSSNTNDYWEKRTIGFPVGVFYDGKQLSVKAGVNYRYWDYDNRDLHADTNECNAFVAVMGDFYGWRFSLDASMNFLGAVGEKHARFSLNKTFGSLLLGAQGNYQEMFPMLYQRHFFGNHANYSWTNKVLTRKTTGKFFLRFENRFVPVQLTTFYTRIDNAPIFKGNVWVSDTNYQVVGVKLNFEYRYKKLLLQAHGLMQQSSNNFLPKTILSARIAYNGGLFKAKKLKTVTGIEIGQYGMYDVLAYQPYMNSYQYSPVQKRFVNMPKLSFYTQYDLGYFRWFIRLENIEQAIIHSKNQEALGFPVVPMQVRFGVSWDFFN